MLVPVTHSDSRAQVHEYQLHIEQRHRASTGIMTCTNLTFYLHPVALERMMKEPWISNYILCWKQSKPLQYIPMENSIT
jgi:hypothetical protein